MNKRSAGVLLHPTSLPGSHGIGDLGRSAIEFTEFLARSGQRWWQMLPLGPLGYGDSPYNSLSAMAGNPLLISLVDLVDEGLLDSKDVRPAALPKEHVDYGSVREFKEHRLKLAFAAFTEKADAVKMSAFEDYCRQEKSWLDDYALFCALKAEHNGASWIHWGKDLAGRKEIALKKAAADLRPTIRLHQFQQFIFERQWNSLREEARRRKIGLIGDVPIFVAYDSADVWAHQELFKLDKAGRPLVVAGVPPDYFSRTGQLWGNPLYKWPVHKRNGYAWWRKRLARALKAFDVLRLDHFIGFLRTWEVPAKDDTAQHGKYKPGPRDHFFKEIRKRMGDIQFIVEDLGTLTPEVHALRRKIKMPGMFVLQFAFGEDVSTAWDAIKSIEPRTVVYTGTHDNDTIVGWFNDDGRAASSRGPEQAEKERKNAQQFLRSNGDDIHWDMIELAYSTKANTAIIPAQDILGLSSEARMNTPGTNARNWQWRAADGAFNTTISSRLLRLTKKYNRS